MALQMAIGVSQWAGMLGFGGGVLGREMPNTDSDVMACRRGVRVAPEKAIVFSQWTGMLDLVEAALGRARLRCRRLDGSMSISAREAAISSFQARGVGWW